MSPNTPPAFEALPVEILGNILRRMASPEDLYSTIRASPKAFGSFLSFREGILIEVLQRHLPAEIFAEFLGLLHIPKSEDFNHVPDQSELEHQDGRDKIPRWEACRHAAWPTLINAFLEKHFENIRAAKSSKIQKYSVPRPADKQEVNYIISMYGTLKRFIVDYQYFVRKILTRVAPPLSVLDPSVRRQEAFLVEHWPPLNVNETLRLQRGFLRYEFWSRLNVTTYWHRHMLPLGKYRVLDLFDSVSMHLQRWEEEEIRCVWTYVHRQYQVLIRNIVEEFRCDIRRLSRKARFARDHEVTIAPDISFGPENDLFCKWPYDMSCFGLPLLQQLLRSEFDDQRRFFKETTAPIYGIYFIHEVFFLDDENPLKNEWHPLYAFHNLPMSNGANAIYEPITRDLAGPYWGMEALDGAERELKEVGWAFWEDRARLEYFALIDSRTNVGGRIKDSGDRIEDCVSRAGYRNFHYLCNFEVEEEFSEQEMFVTKEDYQGELSAKYVVNPQTPGGTQFFIDRLRDISDWSSKKVSPVFQEICSGRSGTD